MTEREKELKRLYKESRPEMGVFAIRNEAAKACYVQAAADLRGVMNGARARLGGGFHPNRGLQHAYNACGAGAFCIEALERLPYDEDPAKTDYSEELALLQMIWEEKLAGEGYALYPARP